MRNIWMIVSGLTVVVAIGGTVHYIYKRAAAPSNPLLTANVGQFTMLLPPDCGMDFFLNPEPPAYRVDMCVRGTVERVALHTGVTLTRADVLDPRVKAHWLEVQKIK